MPMPALILPANSVGSGLKPSNNAVPDPLMVILPANSVGSGLKLCQIFEAET